MRLTRKIRWVVCWRAVTSTLQLQAGRCLAALEKDRENLLFIDVRKRGAYLAYSARVFREKVTIDKAPSDDEILKTPSILFLSLLRLALRLGGR